MKLRWPWRIVKHSEIEEMKRQIEYDKQLAKWHAEEIKEYVHDLDWLEQRDREWLREATGREQIIVCRYRKTHIPLNPQSFNGMCLLRVECPDPPPDSIHGYIILDLPEYNLAVAWREGRIWP